MGQIDMSKIKKGTDNSAKIDELKTSKQAETNTESVGLIDNASEDAEAISKADSDGTQENKEGTVNKVIVTYIGRGIWKDADKKLWASKDKSNNILSERQYSIDEYESREDIKFMVGYGAMRATYVE